MTGKSSSILRAAFTAVALLSLTGFASACPGSHHREQLFTGAFAVEHTTQMLPDGFQQVDVSGAGCVTDAGDAICDNHATQIIGPDGTGEAYYTIKTRGGKVKLHLLATKGAFDQVAMALTFGGIFTIVEGSGTGCFKRATGEGLWSGSAEFTGPPDATGKFPSGPGRWAFWGLMTKQGRAGCR